MSRIRLAPVCVLGDHKHFAGTYFGTLAGKFPITQRTTDLEGPKAGKTHLGICVFMFVTLCLTPSFFPV